MSLFDRIVEVHRESADFPSKYPSLAPLSSRTGLGTAPAEDPGSALAIVQDWKRKPRAKKPKKA